MIAWGIYLGMAALLMLGFERYLAGYIGNRQGLVVVRSLLGIGLFTPGVVNAEEGMYVVPACIGVLFNLLARSGVGMMKAALPMLLAGALVFGVLFLLESLRDRRKQAEVSAAD